VVVLAVVVLAVPAVLAVLAVASTAKSAKTTSAKHAEGLGQLRTWVDPRKLEAVPTTFCSSTNSSTS